MATSTLGSGTLVLAGTTSGTTTVTATAVAGTTTLTLPAATDTLVGKATTDTLTNKTLTAPTLASANITTALTLTGASGTNGQALTSGGSGNAPTWTTIGATPGGSTTQVQYNNAGAFGGISGVTTDGTRMTASTTIGVGAATPSTSGAGITFPATQSASTDANTLDDYEEGTFTPTISAGVTTPSYAVNSARYVKTGVLVYINLYIQFNSVQTLNGSQLVIAGLPFTVTAPTGGNGGGPAITNCSSNFNSSATQPLPILYPSTTTITFYKVNGANFLGTDISAGNFNITIAGCYYAA